VGRGTELPVERPLVGRTHRRSSQEAGSPIMPVGDWGTDTALGTSAAPAPSFRSDFKRSPRSCSHSMYSLQEQTKMACTIRGSIYKTMECKEPPCS
jgi:hypothetical protein